MLSCALFRPLAILSCTLVKFDLLSFVRLRIGNFFCLLINKRVW